MIHEEHEKMDSSYACGNYVYRNDGRLRFG